MLLSCQQDLILEMFDRKKNVCWPKIICVRFQGQHYNMLCNGAQAKITEKPHKHDIIKLQFNFSYTFFLFSVFFFSISCPQIYFKNISKYCTCYWNHWECCSGDTFKIWGIVLLNLVGRDASMCTVVFLRTYIKNSKVELEVITQIPPFVICIAS